MSWLIQSFTYILPNISFTGGNRRIESLCARNHSGSYASEQSQSHETGLHLLSEHVSTTTILFDFGGLRRKGVEGRTHVLLRLRSLPEQAVARAWALGMCRKLEKEIHQVKRSASAQDRTYELFPFMLCQTCSATSS